MKTEFRISGKLYDEVLADLRRPHPFAYERVGFFVGRTVTTDELRMILLWKYVPIPDDHYIKDKSVGARIGKEAIAAGMQIAFEGRGSKDGVFHVHLHDMGGPTGMSNTDSTELPRMIPGFAQMGQDAAHGIIILSADHGSAWLWHGDAWKNAQADRIVVLGPPIRVMEKGKIW